MNLKYDLVMKFQVFIYIFKNIFGNEKRKLLRIWTY